MSAPEIRGHNTGLHEIFTRCSWRTIATASC